MKLTKVIINSVTIKDSDGSPDPNKVLSWEYEKTDDEISEAEIIVPRSISTILDVTNGQTVEIHAGWTTSTDKRFFYGYIDTIKPEGATLKLNCKNNMGLLVRKNVNHIYDSSIDASAGEVSEIAIDLIETYGGMTANAQSSGTADGERVDVFKCVNADIFERLNALKKALDWDIFYDDDADEVHFEPVGFSDSGKTLTVGTEIIGVPTWTFDTENMINDLRVDGATIDTTLTETGRIGTTSGYTTASILLTKTPNSAEIYMDAATPPTTQKTGGSKDGSSGHFYYIDRENKKIMPATGTTFTNAHYAIINYLWSAPAPIHMINQASIDEYGKYEKQITLSDVSSVADTESRAKNILAKRSIPFVVGKIKVKSESANIPDRGQSVAIVDAVSPTVNGQAVSGDYVVSKIKYMFPSAYEELEVGDKEWRLVDWNQDVEERLKRLEEQFVRNQDLLMELVNLGSADTDPIEIFPRYNKIIFQTLAADDLVWGNEDYGTWNSFKWSSTEPTEVDHYIKQYLNTYTEDFIDADFEDSDNGNASWSTTGSVEFTSGQIAQSTSIDYNNGTITTATLTSTEVSGSFDYEMTADGTNWESVTSGVAHTFSSTGTDLRWRATENAASTGEISQIVVEDYH